LPPFPLKEWAPFSPSRGNRSRQLHAITLATPAITGSVRSTQVVILMSTATRARDDVIHRVGARPAAQCADAAGQGEDTFAYALPSLDTRHLRHHGTPLSPCPRRTGSPSILRAHLPRTACPCRSRQQLRYPARRDITRPDHVIQPADGSLRHLLIWRLTSVLLL
jgi:hypothetical protein